MAPRCTGFRGEGARLASGAGGNDGRADVAEMTRGGTVERVGSTAEGRSAGGLAVGAPAGRAEHGPERARRG